METKEAFKIVSEFIKEYYPFAHGKEWDRKNGNLHFMLGIYSLQEYIEELASDEMDIEDYVKQIEEWRKNNEA